MTLGEKLKKLRLDKKMTQQQLCDGKITRNLLSEIECNKASPSVGTLTYLASRLNVPVAFLLSDEDSTFLFDKNSVITDIKREFSEKNYKKCISLLKSFTTLDDELYYILAYSHFFIGRDSVQKGSLVSGSENLKSAALYCAKTIYDTARLESLILMYSALANNIQSPLLEFDIKQFEADLNSAMDYELYRYLIGDTEFPYKNPVLENHIKARELIKKRRFAEAVEVLLKIENIRGGSNYNSHVIFSVYRDLETCYKELADYENAYRYSTKRLSLIEGFKS